MKIELFAFLSTVLSISIVATFLFDCYLNKKIKNAKRNVQLKGKKCEVCFSVYFISSFLKYWRCPVCGSINKDHDY